MSIMLAWILVAVIICIWSTTSLLSLVRKNYREEGKDDKIEWYIYVSIIMTSPVWLTLFIPVLIKSIFSRGKKNTNKADQ